jgi:subtilisin family serine protease
MRAFLLPPAALALSLLASAPGAEPIRRLIVQTSVAPAPPPPRARAAGPLAARLRIGDRLATRLDSLGLGVLGALADGLPAPSPAATRSIAPDAGIRQPRPNPFDLDPARVWLLEAPDSAAAAAAARALADDPAIEWVELSQPREPAVFSLDFAPPPPAHARPGAERTDPAFPSDPFFRDSRQWGLRNLGPSGAYGGRANADIHALDAWQQSTGAGAIRLAIADTGVDPNHPELQAQLSGGSRIELGINVTADPSPSFADSFGHGTPVAGVMAARTGEGAHFDSLGIAGVCGGDGRDNPGCRIVPIKIAPGHSGGATSFDIARAIVYAAGVGARAINLSYAGPGPSRLERTALYYAITRGCVLVAASGNKGDTQGSQPQYPAAYAADGLCVQTGASDCFDRRAAFSSYGPGLDLVAPGLDIWTTYMTYPSAMGVARNGYVAGSGTSFAAPFVTGTIGLLAAARPELTDTDFQQVLRASADDIGAPGVDAETGWGRLDAAAALRSVDPSLGIWHDEVRADSFRPGAVDSLLVSESGPGTMAIPRLWPDARLIEATATVSLPDSFLEPVRVWPRVAGTMTVRGDFRLPYFAPWAEVASIGADSFTLRGYLYELQPCAGCGPETSLPLPLDQARFGFTVIGRADRAPSLEVLTPPARTVISPGDSLAVGWRASDPDEVTAVELWLEGGRAAPLRLARIPGAANGVLARIPCPPPFHGEGVLRVAALDEHGRHRDRTTVAVPIRLAGGSCDTVAPERFALAATPNPFRASTRVTGPPGARVAVLDVSGRVVRRARLDGSLGAFVWDGRDHAGRALGPGLYFVRCQSARGRAQTKVLKLE